MRSPRRHDNARGVFGPLGKGHHVGRQAANGTKHHQVDCERGASRNDRRYKERDKHDVFGIVAHRGFQRRLIHGDLDEVRAHRRRPLHVDDAALWCNERLQCRHDRFPGGVIAQSGRLIDCRRHVGYGEQMTRVPHLQHDHACSDAVQQLALQFCRHHAFGRRFENERRGVGRRKARHEPVRTEVCNRGHIDGDFRQDDKADEQCEDAARKPKPARSGRLLADPRGHRPHRIHRRMLPSALRSAVLNPSSPKSMLTY